MSLLLALLVGCACNGREQLLAHTCSCTSLNVPRINSVFGNLSRVSQRRTSHSVWRNPHAKYSNQNFVCSHLSACQTFHPPDRLSICPSHCLSVLHSPLTASCSHPQTRTHGGRKQLTSAATRHPLHPSFQPPPPATPLHASALSLRASPDGKSSALS